MWSAFAQFAKNADAERENSAGYRSRAVSDNVDQIKGIIRKYLDDNA